jgi:hypothetical protein
MTKLTAEQIQNNWDNMISLIEKHITGERKTKLLDFYNKYQERIMLMPASYKKEYHNAFPGGYVDHVNRVVNCAMKLHDIWQEMGADVSTYTYEELIFSALNHDLGKIGDEYHESYIPQTDQWRRDKLGEEYKFNDRLEYMSVPDRGLYMLTTHGIFASKNEILAIKLHDGLYEESNKSYLTSYLPETKPRTSLVYIIHQADLMAARIEFEKEWLPKFKSNLPKPENNFTLDKKESKSIKSSYDELFGESNNKSTTEQKIKSLPAKAKALSTIKSDSLKNMLDSL